MVNQVACSRRLEAYVPPCASEKRYECAVPKRQTSRPRRLRGNARYRCRRTRQIVLYFGQCQCYPQWSINEAVLGFLKCRFAWLSVEWIDRKEASPAGYRRSCLLRVERSHPAGCGYVELKLTELPSSLSISPMLIGQGQLLNSRSKFRLATLLERFLHR
jgi:hypothetical protein